MNKKIKNIYYFAPDHDTPSGGIKAIYKHVQLLRELGYSAFVLHQTAPFRITWYDFQNIEFKYLGAPDFKLFPEDVLIVGEDIIPLLRAAQSLSCRTIVFNQNWHYAFRSLKHYEGLKIANYKTYGIQKMLTPSKFIAEAMSYTMGLPVFNVGLFIEQQEYYYAPEQKEDQIVYMHRKNADLEYVDAILKERGFTLPCLPLDKLSDKTFAAQLRKAKVYLTGTSQEGYNQPCLEAQACGCIVIGYGGIGGLEFLHDRKNCYLVENGDYIALARKLEEKWPLIQQDTAEIKKVRTNALHTAGKYTEKKVQKRLAEFFDPL